MGRGRPGKGLGHVDALSGARAGKARLKLILETVTGLRTVREAAEALEISEGRFRVLREEALRGALEALEPGVPGRPHQEPSEPEEMRRLRLENRELLFELQAAWTRTELALAMPHVLRERPPAPPEEKGGSTVRGRRRSGGATGDTDGGSSG